MAADGQNTFTTAASCLSSDDDLSAHYVGRFAPSPTGPLHFGSLVAALASYLDARARGGRWLLRMEDLDPPREVPGAAQSILRSLEAHGLHWDGDVLYQGERSEAYWQTLRELDRQGLLYPCYCSRRDVMAAGGIYPGTCRGLTAPGQALATAAGKPAAIRLKTSDLPATFPGDPWSGSPGQIAFKDFVFGAQEQDLAGAGDFIVLRKDGFFAYQLAVVVDDAFQGVSHVLRGSDLLASTPAQIYLLRLLNLKEPAYGHIPVAADKEGQKLSKQQGAAALDDRQAAANLRNALMFLGQNPPAHTLGASCDALLGWALHRWRRELIPAQPSLPVE